MTTNENDHGDKINDNAEPAKRFKSYEELERELMPKRYQERWSTLPPSDLWILSRKIARRIRRERQA